MKLFEVELKNRMDEYQNSCGRKIRYNTIESAQQACKNMKKNHNADLEPYECEYCHGYHVGNKIKNPIIKWLLKAGRKNSKNVGNKAAD